MPRSLRIFAPAILLIVTIASVLLGLAIGGAADPRLLADPGAVIRYGLPILRTVVNVTIAIVIGALVTVVWSLNSEKPETRVALDVAAGAAAALSVACVGVILFSFVDLASIPFSLDEGFGGGLAQFVTTVDLGKLWLLELLLAAVVTVMCFAIRDRRWVLITLGAAMVLTLPLAQQGHAAGASGHAEAVNSLLVHLIGASVWLGGLATLVVLAFVVDRERLSLFVSRYSSLAFFAFLGVAASGIVSAALRVGDFETLFTTGYGQLIVLKSLAVIALGIFGALWRQWAIPRIAKPGGGRLFAVLVAAELAVMAFANGVAGALGRTATPVALEPAREGGTLVPPAEWLTGDPLPPEQMPMSFLTVWRFDLAWTLVCVFAAGMYLAGVWRLSRRGDKWSIGRTIAWLGGLALLFYTTNGALAAYERYLFSTHMLGHMLLTMLIPLILVLGAPITLALRATEKRHDGSWGGREWIMWMVQTPYSKFITHPAVAAVIFAGSLWVFYFSPLFRWAMETHLGHQWMIIHFLISGYLFSLTLIGIDPIPYRFPYSLRVVTLFATMASHAFFGVTIMTLKGLMVADWFGAMGRTWGATPLADQNTGGAIAWGIGELPTLLLALLVTIQWARSDDKLQKRKDRAADRSGDAELKAYNAMLAGQAERDKRMEQAGRK